MRQRRLIPIALAAALLATTAIPAAAAGGEPGPAQVAKKKKCKAKGKSAAAAKKKCKKGGSKPTKPVPPAPTPPQLTITPTSHNYGFVDFMAAPPIKTFEVKNVGGSDSGPVVTTLDDNSMLGAAEWSALFITSNTCGNGTAPAPKGGTCHIGVQFNPMMAGVIANGTLTVSASPGNTVAATLTGGS